MSPRKMPGMLHPVSSKTIEPRRAVPGQRPGFPENGYICRFLKECRGAYLPSGGKGRGRTIPRLASCASAMETSDSWRGASSSIGCS